MNKKQLEKIIKESVDNLLKEYTTDSEVINKLEYLKSTVGADTMLDNIIDWSSSNQLEQFVEWFDEEGYFEGSQYDGMLDEESFETQTNPAQQIKEIINKILDLKNSQYIPFTSPSPSSTELKVKKNVMQALECLYIAYDAACRL